MYIDISHLIVGASIVVFLFFIFILIKKNENKYKVEIYKKYIFDSKLTMVSDIKTVEEYVNNFRRCLDLIKRKKTYSGFYFLSERDKEELFFYNIYLELLLKQIIKKNKGY